MRAAHASFVSIALISIGCLAQESFTPAYRRALREGAMAKVTLKVVDENDAPVTNAMAKVYFDMMNRKGTVMTGVTDTNGLFTAEGLCADYAALTVEKDRFYPTRMRQPIANRDPGHLQDGRWLPWNPTIPVVLREIRNPIPMFVKRAHGKIPNGETAGFDCEKGDFVAPHGNGKTVDFRVTLAVDGVPYKHMTQTIALDALDPDGGFQAMKSHTMSVFKSDHLAPEVGYVSNLVATSVYDVNRGTTGSVLYDGDEHLVFKSRIVRDEHGHVVSANYGKTYGTIVFGRGDDKMEAASIGFLYYFNPTPNDRNLEFDGKNNLFKPDWRSNLNWSQDP